VGFSGGDAGPLVAGAGHFMQRTRRAGARRPAGGVISDGAGSQSSRCSEEERDALNATAALLHEIAKVHLAQTAVLHAKSIATRTWRISQGHPQEGVSWSARSTGYGPCRRDLYHHERMDGRGYPSGLIGQEIPPRAA